MFPSSSDYKDYSKDYKDIVEWVFSDVVRYGLDLANTVPRMPESEPRIPSEELLPLSSRAVLAPKNVVVNDFNEEVLSMFDPTTVIDYVSTDKIQGATDEDYAQFPIEFLNSLELSGLPPHTLRLCPGAVVILLRNLNSEMGLCNGVRGVVVQCTPRCLNLLILTGKCAGQRHFIPRIPLSSQVAELPFTVLSQ